MANKIRFYHIWNVKHILIGLVIIILTLVAMVAYYSHPLWYDSYQLSKYDRAVWGKILSVQEKSIIRQTKLGNKLDIEYYKVQYTYQNGDSTYKQEEDIKGTFLNGYRLKHVLSSPDSSAKVRFLASDPSNSMVDLTEIK